MENNKKGLIKELIYLNKLKLKLSYMDSKNIMAFKELELNLFKELDKLNLSNSVLNKVFYLVMDYCENRIFTYYENDLINDCLAIIN